MLSAVEDNKDRFHVSLVNESHFLLGAQLLRKFYPSKREMCFITSFKCSKCIKESIVSCVLLPGSFLATYIFLKDKWCALTCCKVTLQLLAFYVSEIAKAYKRRSIIHCTILFHRFSNWALPKAGPWLCFLLSLLRKALFNRWVSTPKLLLSGIFIDSVKNRVLLYTPGWFFSSTRALHWFELSLYVFTVLLLSKLICLRKVSFLARC